MAAILNVLILIILAGVIAWLVNMLIPMPGIFHALFNLVLFVVVVIYILQFFSLINPVLPWIKFF